VNVKKALKIAGGFLLIAAGVVMLVTPGPGWLAIGFGLTLLASEYEWARQWRDRLKEQGRKVFHAARH
jgi:hypothetical protein